MDNESNPAMHVADTKETIKSLQVSIAQISMSLQESEQSVTDLISAITFMADCLRRIEVEAGALPAASDGSAAADLILLHCGQAEAGVQHAITAFQFYDRLSQRFMHIQENLRAVVGVIQAPERQHPALWRNLHDKLHSVYSLDQEQRLYQALLSGLSVEQQTACCDEQARSADNGIELF